MVVDGGQAFLDTLSEMGVEYLFFNSGSDFYPILEHLAETRGSPKQVLCLTEQLALSMAQGYSMITRKAQAVLVHAGIGVLQFGGALHNAHRGRTPVLLASGRAPYTFENELAGGKDSPHHWDQELFDQPGSLREYTKWQYEVRTNANLRQVVARALQIANSEPQGPVYLLLPRELLAEETNLQSNQNQSFNSRHKPPSPPDANSESLALIADALLNSQKPIIITEYLGRNPGSVKSLVELSEVLSIGVAELSRRTSNFPTTHQNYLPAFPKEEIESADLLFLIDVDVPWIPSIQKIRPDAKIVQLDIDPEKPRYPMWGFPVDISVVGSSVTALPKLIQLIKKKLPSEEIVHERSANLLSRHEVLRRKLHGAAEKSKSVSNFASVESTLEELNKIKGDDCIVMNEGVSFTKTVENYMDTTLPHTFFGLGGSALGVGMGNALGLKLATPSQDVVSIVGDGSFIYANPPAVFWSAVKYNIPTLTIMINNGGYAAMKRSVDKFYPEGVAKKSNFYAGVRFDPELDYTALTKSLGAVAFRLESNSEIQEILTRAFDEVHRGKPALVELVTEKT